MDKTRQTDVRWEEAVINSRGIKCWQGKKHSLLDGT
jgi:hypothetical protein